MNTPSAFSSKSLTNVSQGFRREHLAKIIFLVTFSLFHYSMAQAEQTSDQLHTPSSTNMFGISFECENGIWVPANPYNDDNIPEACPGGPGGLDSLAGDPWIDTGEDYVRLGWGVILGTISGLVMDGFLAIFGLELELSSDPSPNGDAYNSQQTAGTNTPTGTGGDTGGFVFCPPEKPVLDCRGWGLRNCQCVESLPTPLQ